MYSCRFKNYTVAMVNKSLLPVKVNVPALGEIVFFSHGLKYNINFLLFCKYLSCLYVYISLLHANFVNKWYQCGF